MGSAAIGTVGMLVAGAALDGPACLWGIAGAHTAAQVIGTLWLAGRLHPTVGNLASRRLLPQAGAAVGVGVVAWLVSEGVSPAGRVSSFVLVVAISVLGLAVYGAGLRVLGALPQRGPSSHLPAVGLS